MFNISRLSISNQLYPDLDDQLVRGVEKTRLYCGPPSSWGGQCRGTEQTGSVPLWQARWWCGDPMVAGRQERCGPSVEPKGVRVPIEDLHIPAWAQTCVPTFERLPV